MKALLKQVAKDFFCGNPVKIKFDKEGQGLTKNNLYLLGGRAGPEVGIENLFHEMGHLAEREKEKLLEKPFSGWGFKYGKFWKIGYHCGYEAQTDQAVMRESRVWAYQLSLCRHYGINADPKETVSSAKYIDGFWFFEKRLKEKIKDYHEKENAAIDLLAEMTEELTQEFSFKKFCEEWEERMRIL